jgi:L-threonylcarbamoyladenylate synthase
MMGYRNEIQKCVQALKKGKVILYPTDTIWGLGCDATNDNAVKKIYAIKKRSESKAMISLLANYSSLNQHVKDFPNELYDLIVNNTQPTTVIYKNPIGLSPFLLAEDNSAAIRIAKEDFCQQIIIGLGKPIVSTSANISGSSHPIRYSDIDNEILKQVDYIVNLRRDELMKTASKILRINLNGTIDVIRK